MNLPYRVSAFVSILAAAVTLSTAAIAQSRMVVVELYTSQGCSSCPPADAIFDELAQRDDVVALGLHVNYWDYLGWKDNFAQEQFSLRQEFLNMHIPSRYRRVTPQMVFNGETQVAGARPALIAEQLQEMKQRPPLAAMQLATRGNQIEVRLASLSRRTQPSDIYLVHYQKQAVVPIMNGENQGRVIRYANIVSSWETIGEWNGRDPMILHYTLDSDEPCAILVQARDFGPIYVAKRLD